jgi:hypothetical protein
MMSVNQAGGSITYGTFLDLAADVKPWLQIPGSDTSRDVNLELIVDMVCQWIQGYLGRPVGATRYDRRFDGWAGWQGAYVLLPYYPVLQIVSCVEYRGISGPYTLPESTPTDQVDGFQLSPLTGRLTRVFPGNVQKPWFPGSRNIEVVWVAGFNPVPADLKVAALELTAHWFRNTQQQSANRLGAPGSASEYDPASTGGLWAGIPNRIITLLAPYLQQGIG